MTNATVETKQVRIARKVAEMNKEIIARLNNGEKYIDDHNGNEFTAEAVILFNSETKPQANVCLCLNNTVFCINPMYVQSDGRIHLERMSIGGNINDRGVALKEAVEKYDSVGSIAELIEF